MYSSTVQDHAVNPRNRKKMRDPTAVGEAQYSRCGDRLTLYFRIDNGAITEVSFTARGCGPVIAAASMTTTLLAGRTVEEACGFSAFELHKELGEMPASKRHALLLVFQCLADALSPRES